MRSDPGRFPGIALSDGVLKNPVLASYVSISTVSPG